MCSLGAGISIAVVPFLAIPKRNTLAADSARDGARAEAAGANGTASSFLSLEHEAGKRPTTIARALTERTLTMRSPIAWRGGAMTEAPLMWCLAVAHEPNTYGAPPGSAGEYSGT